MNFSNLYADATGLAHLIFSVLSLLLGTIVLIKKKGTTTHRYYGYGYTISMVGLLVTAFMIYTLYGKFGIFHWLAVLSSVTLLGGILPMIFKRPASYISIHFNAMFWSVFGLYAAFAAETLVRIPHIVIDSGVPNKVFYNLVGVAVFIVMIAANIIIYRKKKHWEAFDKSRKKD